CSDCVRNFPALAESWYKGGLRERLDESLCNGSWMNQFPKTTTYHLEWIKSDHRQILVRLTANSK
ncbi:hypothetical protein LINPERHAP1_LOCUS15061, partial [Linum perenne]